MGLRLVSPTGAGTAVAARVRDEPRNAVPRLVAPVSTAPAAADPPPPLRDRVELGRAPLLRSGRDLLGAVRETQALDFVARAETLGRSITDARTRVELRGFAQQLAARFASQPAADLGPTVFDRFLEHAAALAETDVALLKEFLILVRELVDDDDGPLADFLRQLEHTLDGNTGAPPLEAVNGFLSDLGQGTGVAFSARVAHFFLNVQASGGAVQGNARVEVTEVNVRIAQTTEESDPLALDLDGNGVALTGVDDGRVFDLDADGRLDRTAFVTGGDGFLALDRNGNGAIDDGGELFGDQHGAANGFAELARFDDNADGVIDARDSVFADLRVLGDFDGDGSVAANELRSLAELDIAAVALDARDVTEEAAGGNRLAQRGTFTRADGTTGDAADVLLQFVQG